VVERNRTGNPNVPRVAGSVFGTAKEIDRINKMDKIKEDASSNLDRPCLLNLANPVNLSLFLP
jgi:hypothetical protein